MKIKEVLEFLNDTPYFFVYIGMGINLPDEINGIEVQIRKSRITSGLDVSCPGDIFHFEWDSTEKKWVLSESCEVS